jgi:hypothetical protein
VEHNGAVIEISDESSDGSVDENGVAEASDSSDHAESTHLSESSDESEVDEDDDAEVSDGEDLITISDDEDDSGNADGVSMVKQAKCLNVSFKLSGNSTVDDMRCNVLLCLSCRRSKAVVTGTIQTVATWMISPVVTEVYWILMRYRI